MHKIVRVLLARGPQLDSRQELIKLHCPSVQSPDLCSVDLETVVTTL